MPLQLGCDRLMCGTIVLLTSFGLVMVCSATVASDGLNLLYISKQMVATAICIGLMFILMYFDYRNLRNPKIVITVMVCAACLLLLAALLGSGANTRRFLRLGLFSLQPSEVAKSAVILFLAYYLERNYRQIRSFKVLFVPIAVIAAYSALIYIGRDFGSMVSLLFLGTAMLFFAGIRMKYILTAILPILPLLYFVVWQVPYRRQRILAFLNPEADPLNSGFQILQSQIALGSGGVFGQGLALGKQKMQFLPEAHTDFIFALVGEELGLFGALLLIAAFCCLLLRGLRSALGAPDLFGSLLASGIIVMIVSQALFNMGVVLGLLPTKGMPLPFISYGGSSMVTTLASAGVLLNISCFTR